MSSIIEVDNLRKSYKDDVAIEAVSFSVEEGEIFGIIGPNGAGKTTTVECLQGLRRPDEGGISVLGLDPRTEAAQLRRLIGSQLQESALPDRLKVWEALAMARRLAREEGIFSGGSTGTAVHGALEVARELGPGKLVVVVVCDSGDRYLSKCYDDEWMRDMGYLTPSAGLGTVSEVLEFKGRDVEFADEAVGRHPDLIEEDLARPDPRRRVVVVALRAQRHANADLAAALIHRVRHQAIGADEGQREPERAERAQHSGDHARLLKRVVERLLDGGRARRRHVAIDLANQVLVALVAAQLHEQGPQSGVRVPQLQQFLRLAVQERQGIAVIPGIRTGTTDGVVDHIHPICHSPIN